MRLRVALDRHWAAETKSAYSHSQAGCSHGWSHKPPWAEPKHSDEFTCLRKAFLRTQGRFSPPASECFEIVGHYLSWLLWILSLFLVVSKHDACLECSCTFLRKAAPLRRLEQQLKFDGSHETDPGSEVGSYGPRLNYREPMCRRPHPTKRHITATTFQPRAELGPKSQRRGSKTSCAILSLLLLFNQFNIAMGANTGPVKPRVVAVAAAAMEAPPHDLIAAQTGGAKRCGTGPQGQPSMIRKRALRRAINTAQRAELAQYRGRVIRAAQKPSHFEQQYSW